MNEQSFIRPVIGHYENRVVEYAKRRHLEGLVLKQVALAKKRCLEMGHLRLWKWCFPEVVPQEVVLLISTFEKSGAHSTGKFVSRKLALPKSGVSKKWRFPKMALPKNWRCQKLALRKSGVSKHWRFQKVALPKSGVSQKRC